MGAEGRPARSLRLARVAPLWPEMQGISPLRLCNKDSRKDNFFILIACPAELASPSIRQDRSDALVVCWLEALVDLFLCQPGALRGCRRGGKSEGASDQLGAKKECLCASDRPCVSTAQGTMGGRPLLMVGCGLARGRPVAATPTFVPNGGWVRSPSTST